MKGLKQVHQPQNLPTSCERNDEISQILMANSKEPSSPTLWEHYNWRLFGAT
jgi:hypothetical protein